MRILIEEYQYNYEDVSDVLKGLGVLQDVEGKVVMWATTSTMTQT